MAEHDDLLASIAATTADYRAGEIAAPTPDHVERWVNQFDAAVQEPILREMDHVLKKTYFSKETINGFLKGLIRNDQLVGNDPNTFWMAANFLDIQQGGGSQHDLLSVFDENLKAELGIGINECGGSKVIAEELPTKVAADKAYQNAMKNSDKQNARIEHDKALERAVIELLTDHTELFKQFSDNPSFKKWLSETIFAATYADAS
ncbi:MAG: hypothetical protein QGI70_16905 [Paracoccaceae bacterium]|jgi:hypothetical protein|nr:hypothetical protein [Paracoccaceae bacterium]